MALRPPKARPPVRRTEDRASCSPGMSSGAPSAAPVTAATATSRRGRPTAWDPPAAVARTATNTAVKITVPTVKMTSTSGCPA